MSSHALIVANVPILQDSHGRYNLNTLHQASGADDAKRPSDWLRRKTTKALISELQSQVVNLPFDVVKGGNAPGTYVHELLAISYAGWISPVFQLRVNQAFLDMKRAETSVPVLHDPTMQAIMALAIEQDATKYRLAQVETETSHVRALAEQAIANQQWLSIREYVFVNKLQHQMPPSLQTVFGTWLVGYCQENGIPVRKQPVADRTWKDENAYHVETIAETLPGWLTRQHSQTTLYPVRPRPGA